MKNSYDEIKNLLKASKNMFMTKLMKEDETNIKLIHSLITEDEKENKISKNDVTKKINVGSSIEKNIENDLQKNDKKQAYRISGGIIVFHGKDKSELEITVDEKTAFQETMDEFTNEVSDMVDFNKLNVYPHNVEWSGRIIDFDVDFFFSIGEKNGIYINADMIKADKDFLEKIQKLNSFFDKFKSKWSKILSIRKSTKND